MERFVLRLADETETFLFGSDLASALRPGDFVALTGDLGAGKSALARAVIRSLRNDAELDVPSPTFSIVQLYEGRPPVAHLDLYRLGSADELAELGLEEMLQDGVALVEWADRFADDLPEPGITVHLSEDDRGGRRADISAAGRAAARLRRALEIRNFLRANNCARGWRRPLAGDASARVYEQVSENDGPVQLIMDAPARPDGPPTRHGLPYSRIAHLAENVTPFVAIASALREAGFAAPRIEAADLDAGILLTEHLGAEGVLDEEGKPVPERYLAAGRLLAALHRHRWPRELAGPFGAWHVLPDCDRQSMLAEVELLTDWYLPSMTAREWCEDDRAAHEAAWSAVFDWLAGETSIVLRDYHSPNLIWRPEESGLQRLGLIDFQDALLGPAAYDLASLAQDARVTIPRELEQQIVAEYCAARDDGDFDETALLQDYAILSVQRNAKILGIFVRLDRRDGKPAYLRHLPRIREYMRRSIGHPALAPVRELYERWNLLEEVPA